MEMIRPEDNRLFSILWVFIVSLSLRDGGIRVEGVVDCLVYILYTKHHSTQMASLDLTEQAKQAAVRDGHKEKVPKSLLCCMAYQHATWLMCLGNDYVINSKCQASFKKVIQITLILLKCLRMIAIIILLFSLRKENS